MTYLEIHVGSYDPSVKSDFWGRIRILLRYLNVQFPPSFIVAFSQTFPSYHCFPSKHIIVHWLQPLDIGRLYVMTRLPFGLQTLYG